MQGVPVSKASAIKSKEWKKVKVSNRKMKKCKDLYEEEKRRHEEGLQKYQEDYVEEMDIIRLHKRCNKTKTTTKTGAKAAPKVPKRGYHLFLREQLDKMTGQDQQNCITVLCQEGGKRSKKTLQGYLHTVIG